MTEGEWLNQTDPDEMLAFLYGRASDRKLRWFASACCRRIWHLLTDERCRTVVKVSERHAEGLASDEELAAARKTAEMCEEEERTPGSMAATGAAWTPGAWAAWRAAWAASLEGSDGKERALQCDLLRDIVGNPFRPLTIDPSWLTSEVVRLAQTIHDQRAFDRMSELAESLEEAGCTSQDLLQHCRQMEGHVPGCWVVDALLAKK